MDLESGDLTSQRSNQEADSLSVYQSMKSISAPSSGPSILEIPVVPMHAMPRNLIDNFQPIPNESYVHCIQRHALLVSTFSVPEANILDLKYRQQMANLLFEILETTSNELEDPLTSSMNLQPSLRFFLLYLLKQEQQIWPKETDTIDLVIALSGIHVMLWRITTKVDGILAVHATTTSSCPSLYAFVEPLEVLNTHLKLRLAVLTEFWMGVVTNVVRSLFQNATPPKDKSIKNIIGATAPYMTALLNGLLRPMENFLLAVDDSNERQFLLTRLIDKTIDTTIVELQVTVHRVTDADRRQLQQSIDELRGWMDPISDNLSELPSMKRLDRLYHEWNLLGLDHRKRRSSFDVMMGTLTSDAILKFYRSKPSNVSSRLSSSKSPRGISSRLHPGKSPRK